MRKLTLICCLLLASLVANAQFEKGKWIVNPAVTGLNLSYNSTEKAKLGIGMKAGAFILDNWALMIEAGADWSKNLDVYTLGTGGRYYFDQSGIFLGLGVEATPYKWKDLDSDTDWGMGIEAGYAYFLGRNVTIEPSVYYKWRFNDNDLSTFGIRVGFGLYF